MQEFQSWLTHSQNINHSLTSDFSFIVVDNRCLKNFSYNEHIRQRLIIDKHPISFFTSSSWDDWRFSMKMMRFDNLWLLINIRCPSSHHRDQTIGEFRWRWVHWPMFDHWPTLDAPFLFIEIRLLTNFSQQHYIRQCLTIDQYLTSFYY